MMRIYFSRLITLSVYSMLWGVTFIFLVLVCVPEVRYQIESNYFNSMLIQNISSYSDLDSVLLDLNVSTYDVMPTKSCVQENRENQKTIVLVPYRNRTENLKLFISPLHQHMMNQVSSVFKFLDLLHKIWQLLYLSANIDFLFPKVGKTCFDANI